LSFSLSIGNKASGGPFDKAITSESGFSWIRDQDYRWASLNSVSFGTGRL